jgi:hypothetical protein
LLLFLAGSKFDQGELPMWNPSLPVMIVTIALVAESPASAQRQWRDRAEYELYERIIREQPHGRIPLLLRWEADNPNGEFEASDSPY